jgi:hypothetical protein
VDFYLHGCNRLQPGLAVPATRGAQDGNVTPTSDPKVSLLRRVPALRTRREEELSSLAGRVREYTLPPGAVLIDERAADGQAYVIADGWAAVMVHGEPVSALGPGSFVGDVTQLDGGNRSATVVAKTYLRVLEVGNSAWVNGNGHGGHNGNGSKAVPADVGAEA